MRFEQCHRRSKLTSNVSGSFTNIIHTLALKSQLKFSFQMCGPLQKSCDYQTASELTDVDCNKFQFLTENRKALLKVKQVKINGISYVPNMVVVTDGTTDLPLFGNINAIFVYNNDDVYFLCDELITVCLKEHYACYEIEMGKKQMLIDYRTLYIVSPAVKTKKGTIYVTLKHIL